MCSLHYDPTCLGNLVRHSDSVIPILGTNVDSHITQHMVLEVVEIGLFSSLSYSILMERDGWSP